MTDENKITEYQKLILEVLLEQPELSMNREELIHEVLKRKQRTDSMRDMK